MSRDGLLLAWSTLGAHRVPSAVIFTATTTTVAATIVNQPTLIQLVSATAIISQLLTAACNIETQYRPYGHAAKRSKRRNRIRKQNYESRAENAPVEASADSLYEKANGITYLPPESSTITTTADVHVTGSSLSTSEMTSSNKPDVIDVSESPYSSLVGGGADGIVEDDDELLGDGRGCAGSRNGETGSSSSSSDTDIDEIVDEYEQARMSAVARARADDQLIDIRCATDVTHRRAVRACVAFGASGLTLFAILFHVTQPSSPVAVVACVLAGLVALGSAACLVRLPRNDVTMTSSSRVGACTNSPSVRWVALVSLAAHCCLLAAIPATCCTLLLIWTTVGQYNMHIA